jgi:hypothetical protein
MTELPESTTRSLTMKQTRSFLLVLASIVSLCGVTAFGFLQWTLGHDAGYTEGARTDRDHAYRANEEAESEIRDLKNEFSVLRDAVSASQTVGESTKVDDIGSESSEMVHSLREVVHSLREVVQSLGRELQELRHEVAALQIEIGSTSGAERSDTASDAQSIDPIVFERESEARAANAMREIEAGFFAQESEAQWANDVTSHIEAAVEQLSAEEFAVDASVVDLDCRSSLCRLEVVHYDSQKFHEYELMLSLSFADRLPEFVMNRETDDYGRTRAVFYMAREGYGSSRQGCESWRVKVPLPSVARNGRLVYPLLGEVTN